jgi:hypothetical protein
MTHQGHFWTTLKWDFTQNPGNNYKKQWAMSSSIR